MLRFLTTAKRMIILKNDYKSKAKKVTVIMNDLRKHGWEPNRDYFLLAKEGIIKIFPREGQEMIEVFLKLKRK